MRVAAARQLAHAHAIARCVLSNKRQRGGRLCVHCALNNTALTRAVAHDVLRLVYARGPARRLRLPAAVAGVGWVQRQAVAQRACAVTCEETPRWRAWRQACASLSNVCCASNVALITRLTRLRVRWLATAPASRREDTSSQDLRRQPFHW
jgi:hypothetical protein